MWCNVVAHVSLNGVDFGDSLPFSFVSSLRKYSKRVGEGGDIQISKQHMLRNLISRITMKKLIFFQLEIDKTK